MTSRRVLLCGLLTTLTISLVTADAKEVAIERTAGTNAASTYTAAGHRSLEDRIARLESNSVPWWLSILVSVVVSLFSGAAIVGSFNYWQSKRIARRDATEKIFAEWWSEDFAKIRRYVFADFVPRDRARFNGRGAKEIPSTLGGGQQVLELCFFFDKVGWMGASGLIDVDYVLAPMQHSMRRCWIVMGPLIRFDRGSDARTPDRVYQWGFEWLYKRSCRNHQARLLWSRLRAPRLIPRMEIMKIREEIDLDEAAFRSLMLASNIEIEPESRQDAADEAWFKWWALVG